MYCDCVFQPTKFISCFLLRFCSASRKTMLPDKEINTLRSLFADVELLREEAFQYQLPSFPTSFQSTKLKVVFIFRFGSSNFHAVHLDKIFKVFKSLFGYEESWG